MLREGKMSVWLGHCEKLVRKNWAVEEEREGWGKGWKKKARPGRTLRSSEGSDLILKRLGMIKQLHNCCCVFFLTKKNVEFFTMCVSALHRGRANLLCIVPILVYVLGKQAQPQIIFS